MAQMENTEDSARRLAENMQVPSFAGLPVKASTINLSDDLQRNAQLRKTRAELMKALFNRRGLERLRGISDEDWREAESADSNQG